MTIESDQAIHPENAELAMDVSEAGNKGETDVRDVQPLKHSLPISVRFCERVTDVMFAHPLNTPDFIEVTESGMTIAPVIPLHPLNELAMVVNPLFRITPVIPVHPTNAPLNVIRLLGKVTVPVIPVHPLKEL